jgi:hypothetical protein
MGNRQWAMGNFNFHKKKLPIANCAAGIANCAAGIAYS